MVLAPAARARGTTTNLFTMAPVTEIRRGTFCEVNSSELVRSKWVARARHDIIGTALKKASFVIFIIIGTNFSRPRK
eukprot:m.21107 g.21107  ORF g.21107 m.21107 type:complete len:77 (+) comp7032_c0_seq2:476-706(+)